MFLVGLTGGIGSGKSTVSSRLHAAGCTLIDADAITRDLQRRGQPVHRAIVAEFGTEILLQDGELDRTALASVVFGDRARLERLNHIVHPAVGAEIARRLSDLSATDDIVVLDIPLLAESGRDDLDFTIVVDVDPELAVARLVEFRGFTEVDARSRIAHQAPRDVRLSIADVVIDNSGTLEELGARIDDLVQRLRILAG